MNIEKLREEFEMMSGGDYSPPRAALREFALRVGIPLEEPEPTLEERHPRPWKAPDGRKAVLVRDRNGDMVSLGDLPVKAVLVAAWNREPLLLEIAKEAENFAARLGGMPCLQAFCASIGSNLWSLLVKYRQGELEQREEKS